MAEPIAQLSAADFDEAIDFLNLVFSGYSPHDFARLLPALYRPTDEHMAHNWAIRKDGRIRAVVGLFPRTWQIGQTTLRVAGIGGVSTHPNYRRGGLMRALMQHCVQEMKAQGYHLSWLGGQRQRYLYYGYERCGHGLSATLSKTNIRHCFAAPSPLRLEAIGPQDASRLARARELHDAQPAHGQRPPEDFYLYCTNWYHQPFAALTEDGRMVGYLVANPKSGSVVELLADSGELALETARAWVEQHAEQSASFDLPPLADDLLFQLSRIGDQVSVHATGNWQIFDWPAVVGTLLQLRRRDRPLAEGALVLGIEGQTRLRLQVDGGQSRCQATDEPADLECPAPQAMRLLFGPLPPSLVRPLPERAAALESWCPLPLFWPRQDGV